LFYFSLSFCTCFLFWKQKSKAGFRPCRPKLGKIAETVRKAFTALRYSVFHTQFNVRCTVLLITLSQEISWLLPKPKSLRTSQETALLKPDPW
jgi:hypothetical protein